MEVTTDHRLSPADHDATYELIRFDMLDHVAPADRPRAIILGGQSGAGKSTIASQAMAELGGDANAVKIDTDEIRTYHPSYPALARAGKGASTATQPDAQAWRDRLEAETIDSRRNLVIDTTLGWPDSAEKSARRLQAAGYTVEARVISAHSAESQLGIVARYYEKREVKQAGRWVDMEYHDSVYARIPDSLKRLEEKKLVEAIRIVNREGFDVHSQTLDSTRTWSKPDNAEQALISDRNARGKDTNIHDQVFQSWDEVEKRLDRLSVSGQEREELQALRRLHELQLTGAVQNRTQRAKDFLEGMDVDTRLKYKDDKEMQKAMHVLDEGKKFAKTLGNDALAKVVEQQIRTRLADSLDTGRPIADVATREYQQLRDELETKGPSLNPKDRGPER